MTSRTWIGSTRQHLHVGFNCVRTMYSNMPYNSFERRKVEGRKAITVKPIIPNDVQVECVLQVTVSTKSLHWTKSEGVLVLRVIHCHFTKLAAGVQHSYL